MKNLSLNLKDAIYILVLSCSVGMSIGVTTARVNAAERKVEELLPIGKALAALSERLDALGKKQDDNTQEIRKDVRELRSELRALSR